MPSQSNESKGKLKKIRSKRKQEEVAKDGHTSSPAQSSFYAETYALYLPLAPIAQGNAVKGICAEHLSPLILTYFPPMRGVVLSYSNARFMEHERNSDGRQKTFARAINESAATFIWVQAEFLIFRPLNGDQLEGHINLQTEDSLSLICYNFFSASMERKHLPKSWSYSRTKSTGRRNGTNSGVLHQCFIDEQGQKIEGLVTFGVRGVDCSASVYRESQYFAIRGSLLSPDEEQALQNKQRDGLTSDSHGFGGADQRAGPNEDGDVDMDDA